MIASSDIDRTVAFYREVLGAEVVRQGPAWRLRFGGVQLNVHFPGLAAGPFAREPVRPGNSDLCFEWDGTPDEAIAHLRSRGVEPELGPVTRNGARGEGRSVYFRDPDGSLLELISYPRPPAAR